MEDKFDSLVLGFTWVRVPEEQLPPNQHAWNGKWVYRIKKITKPNEPPQLRYKARWMVKGCQQKYGVDYFETFTAVAKGFCPMATMACCM
jgi:hypothetical protein